MRMLHLRLKQVPLICFLAAIAQGCAGLGGAQSDENRVQERAQARWNARLAGDWETAYSYASPAYRAAFDLKAFTTRFGKGVANWTSAQVKSVHCQETTCDVVMHITYTTPLFNATPYQKKPDVISTDLDERWVKEEGQWWIYLKL